MTHDHTDYHVFTLGTFEVFFLIFIRSRTGLSSSSSSITYPPVVPSENVTTSPSLPSNSTASIWILRFMRGLLHAEEMSGCSELLTQQVQTDCG